MVLCLDATLLYLRIHKNRKQNGIKIIFYSVLCNSVIKNPAYGRHRISRSMVIEAPIQKEAYKATVQCSAVQCSAVQNSAVQCSGVQCSAVQCSAVQCTVLHSTALWPCMLLSVLVLLSASVERFGVSRMRDF